MSAPKQQRSSIGLDHITQAAVELLDEVGLEELTTRRLADKLGIRSPSLYWHVANKAELLDLVAESICAGAFVIDGAQPWQDQLKSGLQQFRQLLVAHRDAAALLRARPPSGPHRLGHIETTMRILSDAGFADHETAGIAQLLTAHVLASVPDRRDPARKGIAAAAHEQTRGQFAGFPTIERVLPVLVTMTDQEKFDLGVDILLDGLTQRLSGHQGHH